MTTAPRPTSPVGSAFGWCIRMYQRVREGRPSPCRFVPSCSSYALEAIEVHGAVKGTGLGIWRICRCNPWGGSGLDPVPRPDSQHECATPSAADSHASASTREEIGTCLT